MNKNNFCKENYLSILELAKKKGYIISTVKNTRKKKNNQTPILILRHDIDLSLDHALEMAKLEYELKIQSTYFILLYNNNYNPFSPEGKTLIKKIASLGHEIGIHWDSRDYEQNTTTNFRKNIEILSDIIGKNIISGSQHEPTTTSLMKAPNLLKYEMYRDFTDFVYVSDSSMKWRQRTPWDLLEKKCNAQFLAHPFWWMAAGKTRKAKFSNYLSNLSQKNAKRVEGDLRQLENFLKVRTDKDKYFGYKNKDI